MTHVIVGIRFCFSLLQFEDVGDRARLHDRRVGLGVEMSLQGGEYVISFGVTGFEQNVFTVYHRLYDALNITVVSDKNTVGYYDMESKCVVQDAKE